MTEKPKFISDYPNDLLSMRHHFIFRNIDFPRSLKLDEC